VRRWPNEVSAWFDRVNALTGDQPASAQDVETAGENLLRTHAKNPDALSFFGRVGANSFSLKVAYLYATKGVRLDRLPDLATQGLSEVEAPRDRGWPSDMYPSSSSSSDTDEMMGWYGRLTAADVWLKVNNVEAARKMVLDLQRRVDNLKPAPDAKDPRQVERQQQAHMGRQVEYWQRMGDLAHLEGRRTDAMTFYQNALFARPSAPPAGQKDELGEKARALWTEIGGSNEGWQAWFTRRDLFGAGSKAPAGMVFTSASRKLPDFDLPMLTGTNLRLADFKGRATLVGIWATW
jgi:hypothetical protein